jgi:hypothetical protein
VAEEMKEMKMTNEMAKISQWQHQRETMSKIKSKMKISAI